jgi:aspartate kinase
MALIVQKYGGTSVGDLERISNVARRVAQTFDDGNQVVVVVSAMAGETDRLIDTAKSITSLPNEREMDALVSSGEQVSSALLAITLESMGYKAKSFLGWQIPLRTDSAHGGARIESISPDRVINDLNNGSIVIVAGFQGINEKGDITTLGRGGSDTSAVAVAAGLNADLCEIYTDVDGVYTTDPNIVPKARKLERIDHEEMLEMASVGAKVLHMRAVELAMNQRTPLVVRSSMNFEPGTLVTKENSEMEGAVVTGVAANAKEAKIRIAGLKDQPGVAAHVFSVLADANIVVDMIVQNLSDQGVTDITFTIPEADIDKALSICEDLKNTLGAKTVTGSNDIAKISLVGAGMRSQPGVASKMFFALAQQGINIEMISTSEIKISCVIKKDLAQEAVKALHEAFELHNEQ